MTRPHILAVDDDRAVLASVERDLRQKYGRDYRVIKVESAEQALAAVQQLKTRGETVALYVVDQRMPVTTGVRPLQENGTRRPEICGNRPVLIAGLQNGEKPFKNAVSSWAPVSVSITVRLPNGSTENISPQVISMRRRPNFLRRLGF